MELQWYIYTKRECWMWGKNKSKGMAATRLFDGLTNSCDNGDNGDKIEKLVKELDPKRGTKLRALVDEARGLYGNTTFMKQLDSQTTLKYQHSQSRA